MAFHAQVEGSRTGMVVMVRTSGDLLKVNPHVHAIAPPGGWDPEGRGVPSSTALCLNQRFRVMATWETAGGASGVSNALRLTDDTGYFWFFCSSNVEIVVKVFDACAISSRYWEFAAGLTSHRCRGGDHRARRLDGRDSHL